jgi:predicted aspartyl protease
MKLSEIRVGKFTVKDVECAVLGPEAVNAESMLGMSFLRHFKL